MVASIFLLLLAVSQIRGRTVTSTTSTSTIITWPPPTTTPTPTEGCGPGGIGCTTETRPPGCNVNGIWYSPGRHQDADEECWRGGIFCYDNGEFAYWDDFTCITTTTPPPPTTTAPPPPTTTRRPGCEYDGQWYPPGEISSGRSGNWCYGTICFEDGSVAVWDNFQCGSTTTPPPPPTTTRRPGCEYGGQWYAPGEISSGRSGNWCYGTICFEDGSVAAWDNFQCGSTSPSTPLPPSRRRTTRPTTIPTTRRAGCMHDGRQYNPGTYKTGQTGNWCYGIICHSDGTVWAWDNWSCGSTAPSTTPPPITRPRTRPTSIATTRRAGCMYQGRHYSPGTYKTGQTGNWCYGITCSPDGTVWAWDNWSCGSATDKSTEATTTLPIFTPSVSSATRREREALRTVLQCVGLFLLPGEALAIMINFNN